MYNLPYFKAKDQQQVVDFMHGHPFVVLCGCGSNGNPVATHLPLLIKEKDQKLFLQGHIMRNTDHHKAFEQNPDVLAVFTGPHTYVSASWYTNPVQASTWNYVTVHAQGTIIFKDHNFLLRVLQETTALFEDNSLSPSLFGHLPAEYIDKLSKAIVSFEIEVKKTEHVFKLSQNHNSETRDNIISQLNLGDDNARQIADLMETNKSL